MMRKHLISIGSIPPNTHIHTFHFYHVHVDNSVPLIFKNLGITEGKCKRNMFLKLLQDIHNVNKSVSYEKLGLILFLIRL